MSDYLILAAEYLGVEVDAILGGNVYDDYIAVVVDKGIAGCPKYHILLSDLDVLANQADDLGVYDMSYRELQALAKELGIPANQGRDALLTALWPAADEEE